MYLPPYLDETKDVSLSDTGRSATPGDTGRQPSPSLSILGDILEP